MFVMQHENVHKLIYDNYNGNATIKYYFISGFWTSKFGETIPQNNTGCTELCILANEQNEIVGYNVESVIEALFLMTFLFILYSEIDKTDKFEDEFEKLMDTNLRLNTPRKQNI
jgi:hypothetical protein